MKKVTLSIMVAIIFTLSSFSFAMAAPSSQNKGQAKKQEVQAKKENKSSDKKVDNSVIRLGNLQIPPAVVRGFKASVTSSADKVTIVSKDKTITIVFTLVSGHVYVSVNGSTPTDVTKIKNGNGKFVVMDFIKNTLEGKAVTTPSAIDLTTKQAIEVKESEDKGNSGNGKGKKDKK